jgi:hypothetical protein
MFRISSPTTLSNQTAASTIAAIPNFFSRMRVGAFSATAQNRGSVQRMLFRRIQFLHQTYRWSAG